MIRPFLLLSLIVSSSCFATLTEKQVTALQPFSLSIEKEKEATLDLSPYRVINQSSEITQNGEIVTYTLEALGPGHYALGTDVQRVVPLSPPYQKDPMSFSLGFAHLRDAGEVQISAQNRREYIDNPQRLDSEISRNQDLLDSRELPWKWILGACGLLVLCWLTFRYRDRFRRRADAALAISPIQRALSALQDLDQQNLPAKGEYEQFYLQVTLIVRQFIEDAHHLNAPEQTTEEFLQTVTQTNLFSDSLKQLLSDFLYTADMVKFARESSSPEECGQAFQAAERFIQQTATTKS